MADRPELIFTTAPIPKRRYTPRRANPRWFTCVNCSGIFCHPQGATSVYCSVKCDSIARAVRYRRSVIDRYGDDLPEDVQDALKYKWAHALGAGYDKTARRLSAERLNQVIERDHGTCVKCGAPGVEIDHIVGDSDDLLNLQLLCVECHHNKTDEQLTPIDDDATRALRDEMVVRSLAPEPLLDCDADDWNRRWRQWARQHEVPQPPDDLVMRR